MKRILLIIAFIFSLAVSFNSCKAQDYIEWVGITQTYEPIKYGALYNWYAATDARNIAASGWHVPSNSECTTLITYLGGSSIAGGKLKETGFTFWDSPNTDATNEVGFNFRGSGTRHSAGFFPANLNQIGYVSTTNSSQALQISYNIATASLVTSSNVSGTGIRLIKDSTTLTHGQSGTYTGNDGKVYRTICIGTQEWIADNLAETKYRNGDWIHGFDGGTYTPISDAAWAALTTEGMCFYGDDLGNK